MEKTHYSAIDFQIRLMTDADYKKLSAFSCGVNTLDHFFQCEVAECVKRHYLASYCAFLGSGEIIAIFTLMNDALMISSQTEKEDFIDDLKFEVDDDIITFFNHQSSYPAINIGHLGISLDYQNKGIGSAIIDLVADTFAEYRQAGCQFITVDALNNPDCIKFYYSNGFFHQTDKDLYSSTRRMYRIL